MSPRSNVRRFLLAFGLFFFCGGVSETVAQEIFEIGRTGQGRASEEARRRAGQEDFVVRGNDSIPLAVVVGTRDGILAHRDSLSFMYPRLYHLRLGTSDPFTTGEITLGPNIGLSDRDYATAETDSRLPALFRLENAPCGGHRIRVHRGALALDNWPTGGCHAAVGANLVNMGTTYGLQVDDEGWALLGVTDDSVAIHWYGRVGVEGTQTGECVPNVNLPCVQIAREGELWKWSFDEAPQPADPGQEAPPLVPLFDPIWSNMVDFLVDDAWPDPFYKSPYFWGGVVGGGALLCLLWLCPGDDVTGTVIINPTR